MNDTTSTVRGSTDLHLRVVSKITGMPPMVAPRLAPELLHNPHRGGRQSHAANDRTSRPSTTALGRVRPLLFLELDRALSLDSLFNALAHSIEALYAADHDNDATSRSG